MDLDADELECDYLCIGAGTSTLSFVDTMLSSTDKSITFVIVDKQPAAGGHWNVAYPFVTLHQASGTYGVSSEPLGKVKNGREILSHEDLATGADIKQIDSWVCVGYTSRTLPMHAKPYRDAICRRGGAKVL